MQEKKVIKKVKLKKGAIQTSFCLISIIFIVACIIFYGNRLIKYYKIYNPKIEGETVELIANAISKDAEIVYEGDGLYRYNGMYIYKGSNVQNYIKYSNMLWRIVKTNVDGSVEIILDDYINIMKYDFNQTDYLKSDIHEYINDVFLKSLNKDLLVKTAICTDKVTNVSNITCDKTNTDKYVKLLSLSDFINSKTTTTYISSNNDLIWLSSASEDKVWHSNGINISQSEPNANYYVKPVVTLKNTTQIIEGEGTKENPYIIEKNENKLAIGTYVKLDNDTWVVYDTSSSDIKLALSSLYKNGNLTYRFDTETNEYNKENKNSIAYYLNNTYYESLSYKDLLIEQTYYIGEYKNSYKDIYDKKTTAYVGLYTVADLKFDSNITGYNLLTPSDEDKIFYYNNNLISSKITLSRAIRPVISIKNTKIKSGNGTKEEPFILEV